MSEKKICYLCKESVQAWRIHIQEKKHKNLLPDSMTVSGFPPGTGLDQLHDYFKSFGVIIKHKLTENHFECSYLNKNSYNTILKSDHTIGGCCLMISWQQENIASNFQKVKNVGAVQQEKGTASSRLPQAKNSNKSNEALPNRHPQAISIINDLENCDQFSEQVKIIRKKQQPDPEEIVKMRSIIQMDLKTQLAVQWPTVKIVLYDCSPIEPQYKKYNLDVFLSKILDAECSEVGILTEISNQLADSKKFSKLHVRAPILKCQHVETRIDCKINVRDTLVEVHTKLLQYYLTLDEKIHPLVTTVKFWIECYNATIFTKRAVWVMVIFYLQQPPYNLPSVATLQKHTKHHNPNKWNLSFTPLQQYVNPRLASATLLELFIGFVKFYASFDYLSQVVCPYLGRAMKKSDFFHPELLPDCFLTYKAVAAAKKFGLNVNSIGLCVQDPYEHMRNITATVPPYAMGEFVHLARNCENFIEDQESKLLAYLLRNSLNFSFVKKCHFEIAKTNGNDDKKWFSEAQYLLVKIMEEVLACDVREVSDLPSIARLYPNIKDGQNIVVFLCKGAKDVWHNRVATMRKVMKTNVKKNPFDLEVATTKLILKNAATLKTNVLITMLFKADRSRLEIGIRTRLECNYFPLLNHFIQIRLEEWMKFSENNDEFISTSKQDEGRVDCNGEDSVAFSESMQIQRETLTVAVLEEKTCEEMQLDSLDVNQESSNENMTNPSQCRIRCTDIQKLRVPSEDDSAKSSAQDNLDGECSTGLDENLDDERVDIGIVTSKPEDIVKKSNIPRVLLTHDEINVKLENGIPDDFFDDLLTDDFIDELSSLKCENGESTLDGAEEMELNNIEQSTNGEFLELNAVVEESTTSERRNIEECQEDILQGTENLIHEKNVENDQVVQSNLEELSKEDDQIGECQDGVLVLTADPIEIEGLCSLDCGDIEEASGEKDRHPSLDLAVDCNPLTEIDVEEREELSVFKEKPKKRVLKRIRKKMKKVLLKVQTTSVDINLENTKESDQSVEEPQEVNPTPDYNQDSHLLKESKEIQNKILPVYIDLTEDPTSSANEDVVSGNENVIPIIDLIEESDSSEESSKKRPSPIVFDLEDKSDRIPSWVLKDLREALKYPCETFHVYNPLDRPLTEPSSKIREPMIGSLSRRDPKKVERVIVKDKILKIQEELELPRHRLQSKKSKMKDEANRPLVSSFREVVLSHSENYERESDVSNIFSSSSLKSVKEPDEKRPTSLRTKTSRRSSSSDSRTIIEQRKTGKTTSDSLKSAGDVDDTNQPRRTLRTTSFSPKRKGYFEAISPELKTKRTLLDSPNSKTNMDRNRKTWRRSSHSPKPRKAIDKTNQDRRIRRTSPLSPRSRMDLDEISPNRKTKKTPPFPARSRSDHDDINQDRRTKRTSPYSPRTRRDLDDVTLDRTSKTKKSLSPKSKRNVEDLGVVPFYPSKFKNCEARYDVVPPLVPEIIKHDIAVPSSNHVVPEVMSYCGLVNSRSLISITLNIDPDRSGVDNGAGSSLDVISRGTESAKKQEILKRCENALKAMTWITNRPKSVAKKPVVAMDKLCESPMTRKPNIRFKFTYPIKKSLKDQFSNALKKILHEAGVDEDAINLRLEPADMVLDNSEPIVFIDDELDAEEKNADMEEDKCKHCAVLNAKVYCDGETQCDIKETETISTQVEELELLEDYCNVEVKEIPSKSDINPGDVASKSDGKPVVEESKPHGKSTGVGETKQVVNENRERGTGLLPKDNQGRPRKFDRFNGVRVRPKPLRRKPLLRTSPPYQRLHPRYSTSHREPRHHYHGPDPADVDYYYCEQNQEHDYPEDLKLNYYFFK